MDLIQELIKRKIIDKRAGAQLKMEAKGSNKAIEEIILKEEILSEQTLFKLKSQLLKIPLKQVVPEKISPEVLELISKESAQYYKMVPLKKEKNSFEVGVVYPEDSQAQEALKFLTRQSKLSYNSFLITLSDFKKCLERYRVPQQEMEKALERLESEIKVEGKEEVAIEKEEFKRLVEEAPIIKMVSVILRQAVKSR